MPKDDKRVYLKKKGKHLDVRKVQAGGEELQRLAAKHAGVTAELVVEKAKNPQSVFHDCFEWHDGAAAVQYRLEQARLLIRTIEIEITYIGDDRPRDLPVTLITRAFQHVTDAEGGSAYQPFHVVRDREDYRDQVEKRLAGELERVAHELRTYEHLKGYATAVDRVAKRVKTAKRRKKP